MNKYRYDVEIPTLTKGGRPSTVVVRATVTVKTNTSRAALTKAKRVYKNLHGAEITSRLLFDQATVTLVGTWDRDVYTRVNQPEPPKTMTAAVGGTATCKVCGRPWVEGKCSGGFVNHKAA